MPMQYASTRIESSAGEHARPASPPSKAKQTSRVIPRLPCPPGAHVRTHAWKAKACRSLFQTAVACKLPVVHAKKRGGYASVIPDCTVCGGMDQTAAAGAFLWKKKKKRSCRWPATVSSHSNGLGGMWAMPMHATVTSAHYC